MTQSPDQGPAPSAEPVRFPADGADLVGNLYHPSLRAAGQRVPAVVVSGTWTSVKEQMADRYAAELACRGLIALSFDFTGLGLSGGQPREVESAAGKARDIHASVSFLQAQPGVDPGRIGALAICASADYTVINAVADPRVRALALVAPWLHGAAIVQQVYGGPDGVEERLRAGREARDRYERGGSAEYVPVADPDDPRAAIPMAVDFYLDPNRGAVPGWPNRFAVMAWTEWLHFDPIALAAPVAVPTLIVHSEQAAVPDGARRFYESLACGKQIVWSGGAQTDFYDQPATVGHAAGRAAAHFARHLAAAGAAAGPAMQGAPR